MGIDLLTISLTLGIIYCIAVCQLYFLIITGSISINQIIATIENTFFEIKKFLPTFSYIPLKEAAP